MLFNSFEYLIFLPIVFLLYWFVFDYWMRSSKYQLTLQNAMVVIASYVFYGWWDWRFLLLIAFTSFCSWGSGLLIGRSNNNASSHIQPSTLRRVFLVGNIVLNLGILAVFKYYDFFVTEFGQLFGISTDSLLLRIILPVGISFYTFQALSYSIDVYRQKIEPTKDIVAFFAFISFFPQLVAGPIERATNLLPQFLRKRTFDYHQATDGMRQILWGLFKKIVIADNCAIYVDQVWADYASQSGSTLALAAVLFAFQIYGDFSGYSDIAIGTAKLFGIQLMRNFNIPYFSRDIAEFWRRWHISLTTWFRDYVYIPLGGSRPNVVEGGILKVENKKKLLIIRNTFVIFLLSGIWHGANWTFLAWGAYHALLFLPLMLMGKNRKYTNQVGAYNDAEGAERLRILPSWREVLQMLVTFVLVVIGWIIFRAPTIGDAWAYICGMGTSLFTLPSQGGYVLWVTIVMIVVMVALEWRYRDRSSAPIPHSKWVYYAMVLAIWWFAVHNTTDFIYFQF